MEKYYQQVIFFIALHASFICQPGFGQNQVHIDSLLHELKSAQGITKVKVWNELSWEYHTFKPEKAIDFGNKALGLAQKLNFEKGIALSLHNIGRAYRAEKDFIRSRKYLFWALSPYETIADSIGLAHCLMDIGEMYKLRGDYKQALDKLRRAVDLFEGDGAREGTSRALANMADAYYSLGRYDNALSLAKKSLAISQKLGTNEGVKEASRILAESYADIGDYDKAYDFYRRYTQLKDSVFAVEKAQEFSLMEEKFAQEKKEAEEKMKQEKAEVLAQSQKQRRDTIQYSLIFLIFVGLFVSIFVIGKFDIPAYYIESLIFLTLLLVFRFVLILLVSFTQEFSEGAPLFILAANVMLALMFMPLHKLMEKRLKKRVILEHIQDEKVPVRSIVPKLKNRINQLGNKLKGKDENEKVEIKSNPSSSSRRQAKTV